jgi:hypothetical protein
VFLILAAYLGGSHHPEPLHPARAAVRIRADGSALHAERAAMFGVAITFAVVASLAAVGE